MREGKKGRKEGRDEAMEGKKIGKKMKSHTLIHHAQRASECLYVTLIIASTINTSYFFEQAFQSRIVHVAMMC